MMENTGCEDEHMVTSLVDYSSSSDDEDDDTKCAKSSPSKHHNCSGSDTLSHSEDETPAPPFKKQCLNDSVSEGNGSANSDLEKKDKMDSCSKDFHDADIYYTESDEDDYDFTSDVDVLTYGRYSWRRADRLYGREVYCVILDTDGPCEESKCLELLDEIGCRRDRFLGLSVESDNVFFANLIKEEAGKLLGLEGVHNVVQFRYTVRDV